MQKLAESAPFVSFETREVEDREKSVVTGNYVCRDVDIACVTPPGSKDQLECVVADWFPMLEKEVKDGRFPAEWLRQLKEGYKAWKEGRELPIEGTPIANWPILSPAQVKMLQSIHIRSVEELAVANETTLSAMGMGGRALKQRAVDWLEAKNGTGALGARLEALTAEVVNLKAENEKLRNQKAAKASGSAAVQL